MYQENIEKPLERFKREMYKINANFNFNKLRNSIQNNQYGQEYVDLISILDKLIFDSDVCIDKVSKGEILYRARVILPDDYKNREKVIGEKENRIHGYNYIESKEPPLYLSSSGRNNIKGSSYLYLAKDKITACAEVKPKTQSLLSVAKFKVKKEIKIIDFANNKSMEKGTSELLNMSVGKFMTNLMESYRTQVSKVEDYKFTQVITDHIRKLGVDGIAYRSSCHTGGINYTIFNCHPNIIEFIDSEVFYTDNISYSFIDLNTRKIEFSEDLEKQKLNAEKYLDILIKDVKDTLKGE